jgi:hypothetical protein
MSCSLRSCGFGKVKNKSVLANTLISRLKKISQKNRSNKKNKRSKGRRSKGRRSKNKRSKGRNRNFGFKFLRNDQIITLVDGSYPQNLTCDRA